VLSSKTIKEFDDRFTSRQFGYSDVKEYYKVRIKRISGRKVSSSVGFT
jgi:predicted alpha/beta-fold hydrolase